jgi:hypothetical protein
MLTCSCVLCECQRKENPLFSSCTTHMHRIGSSLFFCSPKPFCYVLLFLSGSSMLFAGFTLVTFPILLPLNMVGEGSFTLVKDQNGQYIRDKTGEYVKAYKEGLNRMNIGNVVEPWRLIFHLVLTIIFNCKYACSVCCTVYTLLCGC